MQMVDTVKQFGPWKSLGSNDYSVLTQEVKPMQDWLIVYYLYWEN